MTRGYSSAPFGSQNQILSRIARPLLGCVVASAAFALVVSSAQAQSASTLNTRGQDAEARENYDAAFEDYRKAVLKNPKDLRFKERLERMRFQAAVQHIDRGRALRQSGDYSGALTNFLRAAEIDPGNQTARQEIIITQSEQPVPVPTGPGAAAAAEQESQQASVLKDIRSIAGPVQLKPVSNDPITFHATEDVKVVYQAIGKLAGLNVLFDPDYTSKRIQVDLTNVSLPDALRIVGTISGTFYKPVTPNTIFVAQNSRTKRADLDDLAVQTFYLTNTSQPNDANEILTGLRLLLDPSVKLYLVTSQNAIVMRGTSDELLLAQKLINDFDRARPEVVVDVAVLEVNRDKIRNLGITLPQSIGLTPQLSNATSSTTSSTGSTTTTGTTASTSSLTLNNLTNINATNFAVSITGGTLNALLTDSDTRILQNPRIRATDGQRATLKIGSRIPVATGSYNAGVSTGVANIGVQTQFSYLDVGVNIDITPTVHYDREVSLKMKIEVSQQNGSVTISNVTEPIISQRVLEQTIQLQEGEPSILAGIVAHQDNRGTSGTPGLGEIPFFKFFFSTQNREVQQDEIVFLLIPHIVRESVLSRLNTAAIDTGTGQSVELRRDESEENIKRSEQILDPNPPRIATGPRTTAANAASAAINELHDQAQPIKPGTTLPGLLPSTELPVPASALPVPASFGTVSPISFAITPAVADQAVGSTFQTAVVLKNGTDIYAVPMQLQYDPKVLQLVNVDAGDFLSKDGKNATIVHRDEGNGMVAISASRPPQAGGVNGQGNVAMLTFKAIAPGNSNITLVRVGAKNSAQVALPATGGQATVHVK